MRLLAGSVLLVMLAGCGRTASSPLSIPRDLAVTPRVERAVAWVDADRPADHLSEEALAVEALLAIASGTSSGRGRSPHAMETNARVWGELRALEIKSARFLTQYDAKPAWHQVTVGVIAMPYDELVARFDPAADWGRNLASYAGGEVAVDQCGEDGAVTLQRERMVLGTPWYAFGSPDLDMEKYEAVTRTPDSTRIGWVVTASQNRSVDVDVGYLVFRGVLLADRRATLVAFNSIHRIETGVVSFDSFLVGDNVAAAFVAHIERYRRVAGTALPSR